jgi:hypothetical protein
MTTLDPRILQIADEIATCACASYNRQGLSIQEKDHMILLYAAKVCAASLLYYQGQLKVHQALYFDISTFNGDV